MKKMQWGEEPEFSGPRNWFRESLILAEVRKYKKEGRILDFGCGSGNLLMRLCNNTSKGIGVDASKNAIKYFTQRIKKNYRQKTLSAKVGDVQYLFKKKSKNIFDIVVSGETLEHIKDDKKVVKGFFSVLKKNGICVVSVPAHMDLWDINDDFSSHYRRYERKALIEIFTDAGFTVIKCYYWGYPLSFYWHRFIYLPLINKKMEKDKIYTQSPSLLGKILSKDILKTIFSYPFYFDQLFNWTEKGGGLILVAQKKHI